MSYVVVNFFVIKFNGDNSIRTKQYCAFSLFSFKFSPVNGGHEKVDDIYVLCVNGTLCVMNIICLNDGCSSTCFWNLCNQSQ